MFFAQVTIPGPGVLAKHKLVFFLLYTSAFSLSPPSLGFHWLYVRPLPLLTGHQTSLLAWPLVVLVPGVIINQEKRGR